MNIKNGPTSLMFIFLGWLMDDENRQVRIVFVRYWWKQLSRRWKKARSPKRRSVCRKEMRQVAAYMVEMMKESR